MRQLARTVTDHNLQVAFERVETIARKIQSLRRTGGVENRQYTLDRFQQIGTYPAAITAFIEAFEATMLEAPNHQGTP